MTEMYTEFDSIHDLLHYGTPRHSGRYPWGSGDNPFQNSKEFVSYVKDLKADGVSEKDIADGLGISVRELRSMHSRASNAARQQDILMAQKLRDKGLSTQAVADRMGISEATVRNHLKPGSLDRATRIEQTANILREQLKEHKYLDIGAGVEHRMGISREQLRSAVTMLKEEGWQVHIVNNPQVTMPGQFSKAQIIAPEGTKTTEIYKDFDSVGTINAWSEDNGRSYFGIHDPLHIDSSRVKVVYASEGGDQADGTIYVRPGVEDISLGGNTYAQVRIGVDGTHYLKGMAVYKDDLPPGVDIQFNTNKDNTGDKHDAMKPLKIDKDTGDVDIDNPFGSSITRQILKRDSKGNEIVTSAMNMVNEQGDWENWSKSLPSQVMSKQSTELAKQQLNKVVDARTQELNEIKALTNPVVKQHLLMKFSESVDSDAVDLKAAAMDRQATHVILPVKSLKDHEIYAPRYKNGEEVVLIRFPHGGTFEMPTLRVNNNNKEAKSMIGPSAPDAVGINAKVASVLSGADFDGDTVLVIPNDKTSAARLQTSPPLKALKGFDPQRAYPAYDGMPQLTNERKQQLMGDVSNLITDMTIKGATESEIARAVKHSMVVIDAEKHNLNWRQSAKDNAIADLKKKYQGRADAGASTIISRASSPVRVPERKLANQGQGGAIDPVTGELRYVETGKTRYDKKKDAQVPRLSKVKKLALTNDANTLVSSPNGTPIEKTYALHSNRLKGLANQARLEAINTPSTPYSPTAKKVYAKEVESLSSKLSLALSNAPLERKAQRLAQTKVAAKRAANPYEDKETVKKWTNQALVEMRRRLGASRTVIDITPREWEAIQSGAITKTRLSEILKHADIDQVKKYATPKQESGLSTVMLGRARAMLSRDATLSEVADTLGVSASTLSKALKE